MWSGQRALGNLPGLWESSSIPVYPLLLFTEPANASKK